MKRAISLIFLTAACIVCFLSVRGTLPFIPIYGSSMEPTLQSGGLLMIEPIDAKDVKVGDIIVYDVPPMVRDYYNYPNVVAHRVTDIRTQPSLGFRTKGDNTGEDPFTIRPVDLRGTVGDQIPYLGIPLLFFQSQQGLIFAVVALALLAFFLYGGTALVEGRGELIRPLPSVPNMWVVIVVPDVPVPAGKTTSMYAALKPAHFTDGTVTQKLVDNVATGKKIDVSLLFNTFENIAFDDFNLRRVYVEHLEKLGAPHVHLCGSGPALFTLFENKPPAEELYKCCHDQGMQVYLVASL